MKSVKIKGIDVSFHWTMLIMLIFIVMNTGIIGVGIWIILYGSILLHELGHAITANKMGYRCNRIILMLFGGVAIQEMKMEYGHRLKTYIAGPAVSFFLALISISIFIILGICGMPFEHLFMQLFMIIGVINIMLLIFNILPIYPLDGGGIMHCIMLMVCDNEITACKRTAVVSIIWCVMLSIFAIINIKIWLGIFCVIFFIMNRNLYLRGETPASTGKW